MPKKQEDPAQQHEMNIQKLREIQKKAVEDIEEQIEGQIILKKRVRKEITKYVQQTIVALRQKINFVKSFDCNFPKHEHLKSIAT